MDPGAVMHCASGPQTSNLSENTVWSDCLDLFQLDEGKAGQD